MVVDLPSDWIRADNYRILSFLFFSIKVNTVWWIKFWSSIFKLSIHPIHHHRSLMINEYSPFFECTFGHFKYQKKNEIALNMWVAKSFYLLRNNFTYTIYLKFHQTIGWRILVSPSAVFHVEMIYLGICDGIMPN